VGIVDSDASTDALVRNYLGRLDAAAWALPPDRRNELVGEVREHIDEALRTTPANDEVAVRNVLERLGQPEEIVRAEAEGQPYTGPAQATAYASASPWGALEITGVALLAVGGFVIPLLGPIAGLILVWASSRWTRGEKAVATVLALLPVLLFALIYARP
jgi:uncharacterized membrane protein